MTAKIIGPTQVLIIPFTSRRIDLSGLSGYALSRSSDIAVPAVIPRKRSNRKASRDATNPMYSLSITEVYSAQIIWRPTMRMTIRLWIQKLSALAIVFGGVLLSLGDAQSYSIHYFLFFDSDSATPRFSHASVLDQFAKIYHTYPSEIDCVAIVGHSDGAESTFGRRLVSAERASYAREAIIARGIPANRIRAIDRCASQFLVPTWQTVAEPQNRRVELFHGCDGRQGNGQTGAYAGVIDQCQR